MEAEDFLRVINEFDFIRDDIDDIQGKISLTQSEGSKIARAINNIEKAKKILIELFLSIESLDINVREDLEAELIDFE